MGPSPCPCRRSDGSLRASIAAELQGGLGKPGSTAGCAWKEAVPENSEQCDAQHFRGDFQGSGGRLLSYWVVAAVYNKFMLMENVYLNCRMVGRGHAWPTGTASCQEKTSKHFI